MVFCYEGKAEEIKMREEKAEELRRNRVEEGKDVKEDREEQGSLGREGG